MANRRAVITPDDLECGMFVTVLFNHSDVPQYSEMWGEGVNTPHEHLKGTVLRVVALNLPYILVEAFHPQRGEGKLVVDVRNHQFQRLNDEYAQAVRGCVPPKTLDSLENNF